MQASKIVSIVGIRPNFVKLAALYPVISKKFDHKIVHTGQHYDYEMSKSFFSNLRIPKPDYDLDVGSGTHGFQMGEIVKRSEDVILKERPDLVIVYGDGNSTLGGALAAAKLHIPTAHVEAGYRSFDMEMPEEVNRVLTDHCSSVLLAPTRTACTNLKREHVSGTVYRTGDVMVDCLRNYMMVAKEKSNILRRLGLVSKEYILVTIHREKNTQLDRLARIIRMLLSLNEYDFVFPLHPRTRKSLASIGLDRRLEKARNITTTTPLNYLDFVNLEANAKKIMTDSGGVQKEAYVTGVPCITLRDSTEVVETVTEGWNVLVDADQKKIRLALRSFNPLKRKSRISLGDGNSATRISRILASYAKK